MGEGPQGGAGAAIFAVFPDAGRWVRARYPQQPGSLARTLTLHVPGADLRLIPSVIAMTMLVSAVTACGGDATGTGASPATDGPATTAASTDPTVTSTTRPPGITTSAATEPSPTTTTTVAAETTTAEPSPTTTTTPPATTEPEQATTTTATTEPSPTTTAAAETTTTTTEASTTTTTEAPATTTTAAAPTVAISDDVPDIEMFDAATGDLVSLRSVVKGEKPLMFWFWSPF